MNLITLKTFDDAIKAHILRNTLESEGIECFIADENIVTINPLFSNAVGGVKLKVNDFDLEKAQEILKELNDQPFTDENNAIISCPKCSSTNLYSDFKSMKSAKGIFAAIASFLFTVFPIYYKSVYRCKECETEFNPN